MTVVASPDQTLHEAAGERLTCRLCAGASEESIGVVDKAGAGHFLVKLALSAHGQGELSAKAG